MSIERRSSAPSAVTAGQQAELAADAAVPPAGDSLRSGDLGTRGSVDGDKMLGEKADLDKGRQRKSDQDMSHPVDMNQVVMRLNSQRSAEDNVSKGSSTKSPQFVKSNNGDEEEEEEEDYEEEEEGGAHDTITSLAGVQMLQKYKRQIRGHQTGSVSSLRRDHHDSTAKLEDLFKNEPLLEEEELPCFQEDDQPLDDSDEEIFIPPDGGYGWAVSLGAFLALFWTAGLIKSYGVLFAEMVRMYPDNISLLSWIPGTLTTTALATAPVASALCQRLNCRVVTMMGGLLASLGILLSAVLPGLYPMFFCLGFLTGMGVGLSTTPGIILTARYFDKKRARANALCLSGTAAGSFSLPVLIEYLIEEFSLRGTLLVLSSCLLHICIR